MACRYRDVEDPGWMFLCGFEPGYGLVLNPGVLEYYWPMRFNCDKEKTVIAPLSCLSADTYALCADAERALIPVISD